MSKKSLPQEAALRRVLHLAGSHARLAKMLGITRSAVYQWDCIPCQRVQQVCTLFQLSPKQVRPDLSTWHLQLLMQEPFPKPERRTQPEDV